MTRETHRQAAAAPTGTVLASAFQENAAKIYSFLYAKVGNRETAEDLTSQVFLKATRWLAEDRSGDSIRAWLYTTARSCLVDYWREQSRGRQVSLEEAEALLFCGTDGAEEVRRTRERALHLLATLPERERAVLELRFLRGYSAGEIGQALGLSAGNVRVLQLRALRRAAEHATVDLASTDPSSQSAAGTSDAARGQKKGAPEHE